MKQNRRLVVMEGGWTYATGHEPADEPVIIDHGRQCFGCGCEPCLCHSVTVDGKTVPPGEVAD